MGAHLSQPHCHHPPQTRPRSTLCAFIGYSSDHEDPLPVLSSSAGPLVQLAQQTVQQDVPELPDDTSTALWPLNLARSAPRPPPPGSSAPRHTPPMPQQLHTVPSAPSQVPSLPSMPPQVAAPAPSVAAAPKPTMTAALAPPLAPPACNFNKPPVIHFYSRHPPPATAPSPPTPPLAAAPSRRSTIIPSPPRFIKIDPPRPAVCCPHPTG